MRHFRGPLAAAPRVSADVGPFGCTLCAPGAPGVTTDSGKGPPPPASLPCCWSPCRDISAPVRMWMAAQGSGSQNTAPDLGRSVHQLVWLPHSTGSRVPQRLFQNLKFGCSRNFFSPRPQGVVFGVPGGRTRLWTCWDLGGAGGQKGFSWPLLSWTLSGLRPVKGRVGLGPAKLRGAEAF